MKKRLIASILAAVMMLGLASCGSSGGGSGSGSGSGSGGDTSSASTFGDGSNYFLTVAAPPSSSALYSFWVGIGESLNKSFDNVSATVSESQGAVAISKSIRNGEADLGNSVSATDYENYYGVGTFDGDPFTDLRMLFYYEVTWEMFAVAADEGITSISDLDGKRFNPGGTGTSAEAIGQAIFDLFDIKPDYFTSSQSDASDAYSNREIVGTIKLGPTVDSYIMQLNAAVPVTLVSLTEDEAAAITEALPYLITGTIPAGTYDGVDQDTLVVGTPQGCQIRTGTFSQEEEYQLFKAFVEDGASYWQTAYPTGAENDLCELTLSSSVPLAAGTVQYLVEHGYDVPEEIIPPEYVPAA